MARISSSFKSIISCLGLLYVLWNSNLLSRRRNVHIYFSMSKIEVRLDSRTFIEERKEYTI